MLSGIFATPTLRNRSGPPSAPRAPRPAGPRLRGRPLGGRRRPSEGLAGLRRRGGPAPAPKAPRRASRGRPRAWGAPAGAGAPGSAFEVLQDVRQVCGVVAAELFEEVDSDVHWGFLSLFPLRCTSILSTATPPCQAPAVCPSPHFRALYGAVGYRTVRQRGPHFSYRHVTYPNGTYRRVTLPPSRLRLRTRKLRPSKLPRGNIRHRNITQT